MKKQNSSEQYYAASKSNKKVLSNNNILYDEYVDEAPLTSNKLYQADTPTQNVDNNYALQDSNELFTTNKPSSKVTSTQAKFQNDNILDFQENQFDIPLEDRSQSIQNYNTYANKPLPNTMNNNDQLFAANSSNQNYFFSKINNANTVEYQTPVLYQSKSGNNKEENVLFNNYESENEEYLTTPMTDNIKYQQNNLQNQQYSNNANTYEDGVFASSTKKQQVNSLANYKQPHSLYSVTSKNREQHALEYNEEFTPIDGYTPNEMVPTTVVPPPLLKSDLKSHIDDRFSQITPANELKTSNPIHNEVTKEIKSNLLALDFRVKDNLDTKTVNFYSEYALVQDQPEIHNQQIIKKKEESSIKCKARLEQKVSLQQNSPSKSTETPNQEDIALLTLYSYYKSQGFNIFLDDSKTNVIKEPTAAEKYQQQIVSTGQVSNLKYLEVKFEDTKDFNFDKIQSDTKFRNDSIQKVKQAIADNLKVSIDRVVVLNIKKGSVQFEIAVKDVEELEQISTKTFRNIGLAEPTIKVKTLLDYFTLNYQLFDTRYNMYWDVNDKQNLTRGQLFIKSQNKYVPQPYHLPKGYHGYGLNVQKWLQKDQKWLGTDQNAWIVLYHGTNRGINGILNTKLKPGPANAYGGCQCRITGEKIPSGSNVNSYLADNVGPTGSDPYAKPVAIGGKQYKIIFQCRVNPQAVRSPTSNPSYYTVEDSKFDAKENIRPYRLLIKEV